MSAVPFVIIIIQYIHMESLSPTNIKKGIVCFFISFILVKYRMAQFT